MLSWLACVLTLQAPRKHHICIFLLRPDIERTLVALPVLNYKGTMTPHTHTLLCMHAYMYVDYAMAVYVVTHRALG